MQLARRAIVGLRPPSRGYTPLQTGWGVPIIADPARTLGRGILTTGVYDLAVSEALARLISPGDTVVDAGANVGYMTVLASVSAGPTGRVLSYEPHPDLYSVLQQNVVAVRRRWHIARTELHQTALGDQPGRAPLQLPLDFESNDGIAKVALDAPLDGPSIMVQVETLDHFLGVESVAVLKLDVEGFETQVLRGSARALAGHRIRHIVFEDHAVAGSEVVRVLRELGYHIFALGWSIRGPRIQSVEGGRLAAQYEAPNFIATLEPTEVLARCRPRGWLVLGPRLLRNCRGENSGRSEIG